MDKWVKIDSRLPEKNGVYKTKSAYYEEGHKMKFVKRYTRVVPNWENVWFSDSTSPTSSVTHWMELN
jgi:hypothetical protein